MRRNHPHAFDFKMPASACILRTGRQELQQDGVSKARHSACKDICGPHTSFFS